MRTVLTASGTTFCTSCAIKPICLLLSNVLPSCIGAAQWKYTPRNAFTLDSELSTVTMFAFSRLSEIVAPPVGVYTVPVTVTLPST
jgi:hypothetical protein